MAEDRVIPHVSGNSWTVLCCVQAALLVGMQAFELFQECALIFS